jgi:hypothetical protein
MVVGKYTSCVETRMVVYVQDLDGENFHNQYVLRVLSGPCVLQGGGHGLG